MPLTATGIARFDADGVLALIGRLAFRDGPATPHGDRGLPRAQKVEGNLHPGNPIGR